MTKFSLLFMIFQSLREKTRKKVFFWALDSVFDLISMKYGQQPSRKSSFAHMKVTLTQFFSWYGISGQHLLRVEAAKKNSVKKNSQPAKMNFKKKCYIQIVTNIIYFNFYEKIFRFGQNWALRIFFYMIFFAIFWGKWPVAKYGKMMKFHQ